MRLIDADELENKAVEADRMSAMLVVGLGHIRSAPTISQWISVEDRLPEETQDGRHSVSEMVLIYAYNGYSDRFINTDATVDGEWYDYCEPEFEVTHWMELPKPPKESR